MLSKTLTGILTAASLAVSAAPAPAQELLNPLSWFSPRPSYVQGYRTPAYGNASCPGGNCNLSNMSRGYTAQYGAANCPNGFCATPAVNTCPNGNCNVPRTGYYTPSNAGRYPSTTPWTDNYNYNLPVQKRVPSQFYDDEDFYAPVAPRGYYGSAARKPVLDRSVTPARGYDWETDVVTRPQRNYNPNSSPFYP